MIQKKTKIATAATKALSSGRVNTNLSTDVADLLLRAGVAACDSIASTVTCAPMLAFQRWLT